jgi:single-strand DNA-binding protein
MGLYADRTKAEEKIMSDLNVTALVGRLTRDAKVVTTAAGVPYCIVGIAVNRRQKQEDGSWGEKAGFFNFRFYGERAEKLAPYLVKGQAVSITGHLYLDRWESQGVPHSRMDLGIDDLQLIGSPPGKGKNEAAKPSGQEQEGEGQGLPEDGEAGPGMPEADPDLDLGGGAESPAGEGFF